MTSPGTSTRAAVLDEYGGAFTFDDLDLDAPRGDEVRIALVAAGVCHTDAVARAGDYPVPMPIVLGHEGAGVVEAVGADVTDVRVGDHVVLTFVACQACSTCRAGRPALCQLAYERNFLAARPDGSTTLRRPDGGAVHGLFFGQSSFSTHVVAPASSTVMIDPGFDLRLAGPLGCGFQTGAGAVLNSLQPPPGSSIAVFGAGAVGLCAVMAARIAGCTTIVAVDRHAARLELAREVGATHTVLADGTDVVTALRAISSGGVTYALDTTGSPAVVRQGVDALCVAGVFGHIGSTRPGTEVSLDLTHMLFGRVFRGIIEGDSIPREFIPQLVEHHRAGRFPIDRLVQFFAFDELESAFAASERGEAVKPVLLF